MWNWNNVHNQIQFEMRDKFNFSCRTDEWSSVILNGFFFFSAHQNIWWGFYLAHQRQSRERDWRGFNLMHREKWRFFQILNSMSLCKVCESKYFRWAIVRVFQFFNFEFYFALTIDSEEWRRIRFLKLRYAKRIPNTNFNHILDSLSAVCDRNKFTSLILTFQSVLELETSLPHSTERRLAIIHAPTPVLISSRRCNAWDSSLAQSFNLKKKTFTIGTFLTLNDAHALSATIQLFPHCKIIFVFSSVKVCRLSLSLIDF